MSNRTYTAALNDGKGAGNFPYIWDSSLVTTGAGRPITGAWRVYTTADIAINNISLTGSNFVINNVAVTGGQIAITNGSITVVNPVLATSGTTISAGGFIGITGSPQVTIANPILAVSGAFGAGGSSTTLLTGNSLVGITGGTLNVAVTGGVLSSSSSSIALTGFSPTLPPLPVSGLFTATPGNTAITGFNSTIAPLAISGIVTASVSTVDTGNRSVFVVNQANVSSGGWVGITGFSSLIAPLAVSGTFSATIGNVSVTGGLLPTVDTTGNLFLASISGTLVSLLADNVSITGTVLVTDIVAQQLLSGISGALTTNLNAYVPVTGTQIDLQRTYTGGTLPIYSFLAGGGRAVNLAGLGLSTGYNTGDFVVFNMNKNDGSLLTTVMNTAPMPISGVVNTTVTIGNVAVTGGSIQTIVTGTVSANVPNPLGVTGTSVDRALPTVLTPPNFLAIGGRMVNPSGAGSITGYNSTGDMAMLNIASNGGVYVNQGVLDKTQDESTTWMASTGVGPVTSVSGLAPAFFGIALPNNPNRRAWSAVNIGTGGLMIKMSATIPTTGNLDIFLAGATTPWAGNGQSWLDSPAIYTGPVSVSGFGGAPCVYRMWEL